MVRTAWLRRALDILILGLVTWLLVAAAYVTLGRQFVPAVADYQAELVAKVEEITGRAIVLDSLAGEMQGAMPVFTLRGLQVHAEADPDSPILFALDHVTARVDVFASLWQRQPVMDALQIEGLELEVIEQADGQWVLQGLGTRERLERSAEEMLDRLLSQRRITLLDTRILIRPFDLPEWVFSEGDLTLLNGQARHRLDGQLSLPNGELMRVKVNSSGGRDLADMSYEFFADLPSLEWSRWVPAQWLDRARLNQLVGGGNFWGKWHDGALRQLQGDIIVKMLDVQSERPVAPISDLRARFDLAMQEGEQRLRMDELTLKVGEAVWPETRLSATRNVESGDWDVRLDRLPLAPLAAWIPGQIAPDRIAEALTTMAPGGLLRGVHIRGAFPFVPEEVEVKAALDNVSIQPWQGVPGISSISGTLAGTPAAGELKVDSGQWGMHLPRLFPQAWRYDQLLGKMNWTWSQQAGLTLNAPGMLVAGEEGRAAVELSLAVPRPPEVPSMHLRVALSDSQAHFHQRYLPTLAPAFSPALAEWFESAQITGTVPLAILSYDGPVKKDLDPEQRQLQLYAQLLQGSLIFQPGWPALQEVQGTLRLHNNSVLINQGSARLWSSEARSVTVATDRENADEPLRLLIAGNVTGPVEDALRLMQDTPLADLTDQAVSGWTGSGQLDGEFELAISVQQQPARSDPELRLAGRADAAELSIPQFQAPITDLSGHFEYLHGKGLTSDELEFKFLGGDIAAQIDVVDAAQIIQMSGNHTVESLRRWPLLEGVPLDMASGQSAWQAEIAIAPGRQTVELETALTGLELDLPPPFAKEAGTSLPSSLTLDLSEGSQRWAFLLGEEIDGAILAANDRLRGEVRFRRGAAAVPEREGLLLSGSFEEIDWDAWQRWMDERVVGPDSDAQRIAPEVASNITLRKVDVDIRRFLGFGRELEQLSVRGEHADQAWTVHVEQADILGRVIVPEGDAPVVVDLERLRLERTSAGPEVDALVEPLVPDDPLADIDPATLPAVDLAIRNLFWGDDRVGATSFRLRPISQGVAISDIEFGLRGGMTLAGALEWGGENTHTRFTGNLQAQDIGEVLTAWGYAPTLTSSQFGADAVLEWPGSPAFFALKRSSGELQLAAEDGVLQSGEGSADALRVFGLLNFNALTRRLRLDFSDLFGKGTTYDTLRGDLRFTDGVMRTREPLVMDGPSAKIQLDGTVNLPQSSIDLGMLVTLPLTNNLPLAAVIVGAPYVGGALFIVDKLLGDRMARFASVKYKVSGDWQQPTVEFDRAFDNKAALEE
ncbi:MAG TPA: TIGR02099 family protein [Pseudomonas xinjiangensis]|uniref:TIGR02099 family protein n=2 Tax=root TaxID=1 RepID=A0A7V1BNB4_9GAMM|nr:TIGR02099 family protein [Halopseudomonas xinjiangensis]HEC49208.1 TIGR02099 family protein [Halopseudomonas xinjiangensis]